MKQETVPDPRFASAEALCIRHWNEYRASDPELARIDLALAHANRLLVTEYRGSHLYAEALKQWHFYRDARKRILESRFPK